MSVAQEQALKTQLKQLQEKRMRKEQQEVKKKKEAKKRLHQREQEELRRRKLEKKAKNIQKAKRLEDEKRKRLEQKRIMKEQRQKIEAIHSLEKKRKQAERHAAFLIKDEQDSRAADERLSREVVVEFDIKSIKPILQQTMERFGAIESTRMSPFGFCVRYKRRASAKSALKNNKIMTKLPSTVVPQEIKRNAVHFEAPVEMGDIDLDLLTQVKDAMGAYGAVANIKQRSRFVIIFFEARESAKSLTEGGDEVTIEMGGHTIALLPGVPASPRKRSQANKRAKAEARKAEQSRPSKTPKMEH